MNPSESASAERHFSATYGEDVVLSDGRTVHLRLVHPDDKGLIHDGFRRLSPQSRYRRFFSYKNDLREDELAYLTEFDGENHLAIGATFQTEEGERRGVGVARFVRLPEDPACAEAAVAVVDDFQNHGLGRTLLDRLIAAAQERGIERFRVEVLAHNAPVDAWLQEAGDLVTHTTGTLGERTISVRLPRPSEGTERRAAAERDGAPHALLRATAAGLARVVVPKRFSPGEE